MGRTASRFAALAISDAVLSPLSTILLEGLLMRRPILCLYPEDEIVAEFAPANAPLSHFAEILAHPDVVVVRRDQDLAPGLDRLMALVADPSAQARLSRLIDQIVARFEDDYADRLNAFVEGLLARRAAPVSTDRAFA